MKKLGFVTPWFGEKIPGGAEMELRGLVEHLFQAGVELEVLTTCVKDFYSDWSKNYHKPGIDYVNRIPVRRFKARKRNKPLFDSINIKLMNQMPITPEEEEIFEREMVNSPDLYQYMREHKEDYALFIFIPYMFGTTYYGCQIAPEKSVLIPCFHDESYVYMEIFKAAFSKVAGVIYHAQPEYDLINGIYDMHSVKQAVLGEGVYTELTCNAQQAQEKFQLQAPFLLYAGRKDVGKNIYTLITYFTEYKHRKKNDLQLVLIGGGQVEIPESVKDDVIDLGYVDIQDKYDITAAATALCQPSKNESFSLVIMESWLCGRPVIVNDACKVTKHFAKTSNGGFYFSNYFEFEAIVDYYLKHPDESAIIGQQGRKFVLENFAWDVIVKRYMGFFKNLE